MNSARENVATFHSWHSDRTFSEGHPEVDPWLRNVLVSLQSTLNLLAEQIDDNTSRLERAEAHLRRQ